jgi:glutamate dehydrogenase
MRSLGTRGLLDRPLEALPSDMEMQERARAGRGLTRPELAVLLSFAKIALQHDLLESEVPDTPALESWLTAYFPTALRERYAGGIEKHSLRREIIALGLTNAIINRGGPAMAVRLADETARTTADVAYAFLATREVFELPALWLRIDALDGRAKGDAQLALYAATQDLVNAQTLWFLRNGAAMSDLAGTIARHRAGAAGLRLALAAVLPERQRAQLDAESQRLAAAGVPGELAAEVASLGVLGLAPPIAEIAAETTTAVADAARVYLAIGEQLRMSDLVTKAGAIATPDYYDRVAVAQALNQLASAQAAFTRDAIRSGDADAAQAWAERQGARLGRVKAMLEEIAGDSTLTVSRLLVAAGQLGDLGLTSAAVPSASARRGRAAGRPRSAASGSLPPRKPERQPRS